MTELELTRRRLLALGLALPPLVGLAAGAERLLDAADGATVPLAPTPACDDEETLRQTEGPYFTPRSPLRRSLVKAGVPGTRLTLTGRVLDTRCRPVRRALVDFWQADSRGTYDNEGYGFRGHQFTDAKGRYQLTTVVPGRYPGRTRHIHVKVQAPRRPVLTTQLYFPGESGNRSDGIFDADLLVTGWRRAGSRRLARFDFVLDI